MFQQNAPFIRPLTAADTAAVNALAREMRRWFSPSDLRDIATLLSEDPSGWAAVDALGTIVGFLLDARTAEATMREVAWMAVAEDWQGRGAGSMLLDRLEGAAGAAGIRALEVSTVAESAGYAPYEATRAFYHHRGFVDVRVDPDYYWPGGDRLVLRKALATGTTR